MLCASSRSCGSASYKEVDKNDDEEEDRKQLDHTYVGLHCEGSRRANGCGSESSHEAAPECKGALKSEELTGFHQPEPPCFLSWKPFQCEESMNRAL